MEFNQKISSYSLVITIVFSYGIQFVNKIIFFHAERLSKLSIVELNAN